MIGNYIGRIELKPGKYAYIQAPSYRTDAIRFLELAKHRWRPPSWFYHFAKGGHVAALRQHTKFQYHATLDVQDFFGSVTKSKIIRRLKALGYSFVEASAIAADSTVSIGTNFALPYGFVQSPYLASLALAESALGRAMKSVRRSGVMITVYMDDIVLSHDSVSVLSAAMEELSIAAESSSFQLNALKQQGPQRVITAFNILLSKNYLEIAPERFLDFREVVIQNPPEPVVNGIIGYVRTVNHDQAQALEQERR